MGENGRKLGKQSKCPKLLKQFSELSQNVPKFSKMSQNVSKCPLQTHRCPNGLVLTDLRFYFRSLKKIHVRLSCQSCPLSPELLHISQQSSTCQSSWLTTSSNSSTCNLTILPVGFDRTGIPACSVHFFKCPVHEATTPRRTNLGGQNPTTHSSIYMFSNLLSIWFANSIILLGKGLKWYHKSECPSLWK